MSLNLHRAEFLTSAVNARGYPVHDLKEIALVGRSNVGKSSLINTLVNRRKFARTSTQPGRTQTINFYQVDSLCLGGPAGLRICQGTGGCAQRMAAHD